MAPWAQRGDVREGKEASSATLRGAQHCQRAWGKCLPGCMAGCTCHVLGYAQSLDIRRWAGLGQREGPALPGARTGQAEPQCSPRRAAYQGPGECGQTHAHALSGCWSWHSHGHTEATKPGTSIFTGPAWNTCFLQPRKLTQFTAVLTCAHPPRTPPPPPCFSTPTTTSPPGPFMLPQRSVPKGAAHGVVDCIISPILPFHTCSLAIRECSSPPLGFRLSGVALCWPRAYGQRSHCANSRPGS